MMAGNLGKGSAGEVCLFRLSVIALGGNQEHRRDAYDTLGLVTCAPLGADHEFVNWLDTTRVARARQGFEVGGDCIAILRRSRNAGRSSAEANSAFYEIQQAKLQRTQTIDVPTLFIAGSLDGCTLPDSSRNVEEFYRADYQRIDLPTTGHFPHRERPQVVGDLILGVMEW